MNASIPHDHITAWLHHAKQLAITDALQSIHDDIAAATATRAPKCQSSGRCCQFEKFGHRLYTTGIEAAHTLLASQNQPSTPQQTLLPILTDASRNTGCPFQEGKRCTIHMIRPAGCRIFFCDPTAQDWQQELTERTQQRIRTLHDQHDIPYVYADWRILLEAFATQGITTG